MLSAIGCTLNNNMGTTVYFSAIILQVLLSLVWAGVSQDCSSGPTGHFNLITAVEAEAICAENGIGIVGVRVSWQISHDNVSMIYMTSSLTIELTKGRMPCNQNHEGIIMHSPTDLDLIDFSADFFELQPLECNNIYTPRAIVRDQSNVMQCICGSSIIYGCEAGSTSFATTSRQSGLDRPQLMQVRITDTCTLNISWAYSIPGYYNRNDTGTVTRLIVELTPMSDSNGTGIDSQGQSQTISIPLEVSSNCYSTFDTATTHDRQCSISSALQTSGIMLDPGTLLSLKVAVLYNCIMIAPFSNEINITIPAQESIRSCTMSEDDGITRTTQYAESSPTTGHRNPSSTITVSTSKKHNTLGPTSSPKSKPSTSLLAGLSAIGIAVLGSAIVITILIFALAIRFTNRRKQKQEQKTMNVYETIGMPDTCNSQSNVDINLSRRNQAELAENADSEPSPDNQTCSKSDSIALCTVKNVLYEEAAEPKVMEFDREVCTMEGKQITLRVAFSGIPKPNLSWTFNGSKVEGDYAIEVGTDGSLLFVCVEKKYSGRYHFVVSNSLGSVEGDVNLIVQNEDESKEDVIQTNGLESHLVTEDKFGDYIDSSHSNNNNMFILQYQSLATGEEGKLVDVGKLEINRPLNRFRNITAYDDKRIVLVHIRDYYDSQTDYINASYIHGYSQEKQYIASQGPLPNTITDFWQMVWQEKVRIIAMVTNICEGWSKKCEQYWPDCGSGESYGPFNITLVEEVIFADYTIRTLQLTHTGEQGGSCKVTQYHFTSWPDHGVPEYAGPILNYLRRIKAQHKPSKGPILVHCSAGVGRTGTLIAIDIALAQAAKERQVDIPKIIVDMRKQRMKMVQTADQYAFIHDAVLESLMCGDTQIQSCNLRRGLEKLKKMDKETTGFQKHFKVLEQVSPKPSEVYAESAMRYPEKNRNKNFLPPEKWRVTLKGEIPDYVNASFANGYKQKKGFIIAQSPMENTASDFVKMLYQRECGVVVMLCGCEEGGVEMCAQYWPTSAGITMKYGELLVSNTNTSTSDDITKRILHISDPKSDKVQKVTQFQIDQWSEGGVCSNPQALMEILDQVGVVQRRTGNKPIIIHGRDTVSRVGVFCSIVNAIEMCKTEGVVDVFQVVKALRIQKPGAVQTVNQYRSIFDLVLLFVDSFSVYSNFK